MAKWTCALVVAALSIATPVVAAGGASPTLAPPSGHASGVPRADARTSVDGTAWHGDNTPIPGARLRLRDVVAGRIVAANVADELGRFSFNGLEGGSYLVELVSERGNVLAVSHVFAIAPGETVVTFVRLGSRVPWFTAFFSNAAAAAATTAAAIGVTAIAPVSPPASRTR